MTDLRDDEPVTLQQGSNTVLPLWDRLHFALSERDTLIARQIMTNNDDDPPPAVMLDRFEILRKVGAGGMGVVFEAIDTKLRRRVALKICTVASGDAAAAMEHEARCLAKLAHPNIVAVHDTVRVDDDLVLVMGFIDGQTLTAWRRETNPTWRAVLDCCIVAGRALVAVHAAGLQHQDFKPDNVLIDARGRVYVVDFGVARYSTNERPGGTRSYMAPERLQGQLGGPRADLFSFCVSAWESVYGARPFTGLTEFELVLAIESGEPETSLLPSAVPESVRAVLMKGLAFEASDRHESMDELLAALDEALDGQERRAARRRRRLVIASVAGSVLMTLVMAVALVMALREVATQPAVPESDPVEDLLGFATDEAQNGDPDRAVSFLEHARARARRDGDDKGLRRVAESAIEIGNRFAMSDQVHQALASWAVAQDALIELGERETFERLREIEARLKRD